MGRAAQRKWINRAMKWRVRIELDEEDGGSLAGEYLARFHRIRKWRLIYEYDKMLGDYNAGADGSDVQERDVREGTGGGRVEVL